MKNKYFYVTYHILEIGGYTPILIVCNTEEEMYDVLYDACSLHGLTHVRKNQSGKARRDAIRLTAKDHYKYDWHKWSKEYYNNYFNPDYFNKNQIKNA